MSSSSTRPAPQLADKLGFLRHGAWPGSKVEEVETHMSYVFLTEDRAYKLKKPVVHDFLDYRSLEARRRDCEAEFELNQRLAPGVYLGTARLTVDDRGTLALGGTGTIVDWLVVMERLATDDLLDHRIAHGHVAEASLDPVIEVLVDFYRSAPQQPMDPGDYRHRLHHQSATDLADLRRHEDLLDGHRVRNIGDRLLPLIAQSPTIADRAGRLVDGHGDLRPEHIALGPTPLILDRVSFDPELRRVDPLYDLALLAVECEQQRANALARYLLAAYQQRSGDRVPAELTDLYQAVRAVTRAKLSIAHLDDGDDDGTTRWVRRTQRYLIIAARHLDSVPSG